ncbi:hypothetical protein OIV83_005585 [Microbotryomycetes sp. JL201]|nr:hypothetical protein OIV83_005585 [Microbotryomycetes sp. JL201]
MAAKVKKFVFEQHPVVGIALIYGSLNATGDFCAQFFFSSAPYNVGRTVRFWIFGVGIAPLAVKWNAYLEYRYPLRTPPPTSSPLAEEAVPLEMVTVASPIVVASPLLGANEGKLHRRTNSSGSAIEPSTVTENLLKPLPEEPAAPKSINMFVLSKRLVWDQIIMAPISFILFFVCMGLMEGVGADAILRKIESSLWPVLLTNWKVWPLIQIVMFLYVPLQARVSLPAAPS